VPERGRQALTALLAVGAFALALTGAPAQAATGHLFLSQLTEAPPGTPLQEPQGAAVDGEGNVFVVDSVADRIDVYQPSGAFKTQFGQGVLAGDVRGVAVDNSTGFVYVADTGLDEVDVFKPNGSGGYQLLSRWNGAGTPSKHFGQVVGVAVNASAGKVYVSDSIENQIDVFEASAPGPEEAQEGSFLSALKSGATEEVGGLAVNESSGQLYVADVGWVDVFEASGKLETKIKGGGTPPKTLEPVGVGVDPATGDVYVADASANVVDQFDSSGAWIGWLVVAAGKPFGEVSGVAIAPTGHSNAGDVYVTDAGRAAVDVFGPSGVVPSVKTLKASSIERATAPFFVATLKGKINPEGIEAKYHFEYDEAEKVETTGEFEFSTPIVSAGSGSTEVAVSAVATELKPETEYFFRIVGENANGTSYGSTGSELLTTGSFVTPPAVTGVTTLAATNIEPTGATLNGSLEPEGLATEYHFEYGQTTAYGKSTPTVGTNSGSLTAVEAAIAELRENTTYHFRLVASNEWGTTFGVDRQFATSGPPRIGAVATKPITHTTATIRATINPDQLETKYHFEYGETTAYGSNGPEESIPAGTSPVEKSLELTGLKLATTYHFRVVASNSAGETVGPDQEFTTVLIESESAIDITKDCEEPDCATLQAQINPLGTPTTFHFEYGETTSYGTSTGEESAGSGETDQVEQVTINGLSPSTTYHYRVVAKVEGLGVGFGADRTFVTPPSGAEFKLPDGREWEMVSPPNKRGGFIEGISRIGGAVQSSEDGNSIAYVVDGPIVEDAEGNRSPEVQQALSTRNSSGWASQEIVSRHTAAFGVRSGVPPEFYVFSGDLSLSLAQPFPYGLSNLAEPPLAPPTSEAERGHQEKTIYLRADPPIAPGAADEQIYAEAVSEGNKLGEELGEPNTPGFLPLITAANVAPGTEFGGTALSGQSVELTVAPLDATPDLTHVIITSSKALLGEGSAAGLYEWSGGQLHFVSVLPGAEGPATDPELGFGAGQRAHQVGTNFRHAISDDGSRVVWTNAGSSSSEGGFDGLGHLYLRDMSKGETLQLDAPEAGIAEAPFGRAMFQTASADGSKVFFTDTEQLTADSSAGQEIEGEVARPDLYECEIEVEAGKLKCKLSDLTADQTPGESAAVQGVVLGASDDGSSVYLVANGVLTTTPNARGETAAPGACTRKAQAPPPPGTTCNLYLLHNDGSKWTTTFIARLSSEDAPVWHNPNLTALLLIDTAARVSPNGGYLAFMSNRRLTGYDNTDVNEETGRHADEEVFLYSAETNEVKCVSCDPTGARPRGVADVSIAGEGAGLVADREELWVTENNPGIAHWLAGNIPGWTPLFINGAIRQSRYLSDQGRLFFNAASSIVPEARGHTRSETIEKKQASVGVTKVYEFEQNGQGSCTDAGGCVALISEPASDRESAFMDASASGDDVFFLTASPLLPEDQDSAFDVYDARVCGSSCLPTIPPPPPKCTETNTCRPGEFPAPSFGPPASSNLSTPGNLTGTTKPPPAPPSTPTLTRAQKLAKALKACRKKPHKTKAQRRRRAKCVAKARKAYGARSAALRARHHRRHHASRTARRRS
jgi:DNA-binding beta-propeller fold protein YncE